jgi:hypothetical protein
MPGSVDDVEGQKGGLPWAEYKGDFVGTSDFLDIRPGFWQDRPLFLATSPVIRQRGGHVCEGHHPLPVEIIGAFRAVPDVPQASSVVFVWTRR